MLHILNGPLANGFKGFLYLDPGSGTALLQVLIAALLGVGIAVRLLWSRIKSLFPSKKDPGTPEDNDN